MFRSIDKLKSLPQQNLIQLFEQRAEYNDNYRELFGKILETYLELPLKLKPIFDRIKKFE